MRTADLPHMGNAQFRYGGEHLRRYGVELAAAVLFNCSVRYTGIVEISEQSRQHLVYYGLLSHKFKDFSTRRKISQNIQHQQIRDTTVSQMSQNLNLDSPSDNPIF